MHKLLLFFILFPIVTYAQLDTDAIEFGILPSEYAEGMPPNEFLEIEEKIIDILKSIPRYKVVKTQEDYYDTQFGEDWYTQLEEIRKQGIQSNVPYLLQIVFGDTEWLSVNETVEITKAVIKDGEVTTPAKTKKFWTQSATIWVSLNIYKVETGEMEESLTFNASSSNNFEFNRLGPHIRQDHRLAVEKAKAVLYPKIKSKIKKVAPLNVRLLEPIDQSDKAINTIAINAGRFHGLSVKEKLYIYYENEHIINGKSVIREIDAGSLEVIELNDKTAVCKVKKGSKKLKKLLNEKKDLKCNFKDFIGWADGYGF